MRPSTKYQVQALLDKLLLPILNARKALTHGVGCKGGGQRKDLVTLLELHRLQPFVRSSRDGEVGALQQCLVQ